MLMVRRGLPRLSKLVLLEGQYFLSVFFNPNPLSFLCFVTIAHLMRCNFLFRLWNPTQNSIIFGQFFLL